MAYRPRLGKPEDLPEATKEEADYAWHYLMERTVPDPRSGCWEWEMATNRGGYGILRQRGQFWLAHRYAYHFLVGYLPRTSVVHHKCSNQQCVNPEHLQAVSGSENVAEMLGRHQLLEEIHHLQEYVESLQAELVTYKGRE